LRKVVRRVIAIVAPGTMMRGAVIATDHTASFMPNTWVSNFNKLQNQPGEIDATSSAYASLTQVLAADARRDGRVRGQPQV